MDDIYIARQPVYDHDLKVIGYELLFRNSEINSAEFDDGNLASCQTIVNSFIHIGIENLVGTSLAFVNLPSEFITNSELVPMFHEQSVLEILEYVSPSDEIIAGIRELKSKGFQIALDDFVYKDEMIPLLQLADYVKLDVLEHDYDELENILALLKKYNVKTIAEKVETQQLYQQCRQLVFDYYQGYFFCYPEVVAHKNMPASKLVIMSLMSKLHNPDIEYDELEKILTQDITLTYKLLRYINSAAFSLRREIETIKDAIVLLGIAAIKNWATLILMSRIAENKPQELIKTALVRAKMAELLAHQLMPGIEKPIFICGLFSVLDALMDRPMVDLLDTIILSTPIKLALLDFEGDLGNLVKHTIWYEQAKFDLLHAEGVNTELYYDSYMSAVKWADETMKAIQ